MWNIRRRVVGVGEAAGRSNAGRRQPGGSRTCSDRTLSHKAGDDTVPCQAVVKASADQLFDAGAVLWRILGKHLFQVWVWVGRGGKA